MLALALSKLYSRSSYIAFTHAGTSPQIESKSSTAKQPAEIWAVLFFCCLPNVVLLILLRFIHYRYAQQILRRFYQVLQDQLYLR